MASSTTGERRWASTKRGGLTVLGKVSVPKPINLPSQRLENHGLDPNVEIVPKGSLSWGARSSSSGSNAWGSSALSPRTEGGSASPSHLSGRPSSGGGTRPSTAGSEITTETTSNLRTSNSRPSSASGVLASSNTSMMSLRPHSADTRSGSSQLSRFAEPLAEGTASRGASSSADKMGRATSASDDFSLSSRDFPTLGSEKDSGNNVESLDHNSLGRPDSSSGGPSTGKMNAAPGDVKNGMVNSWNNDAPQSFADGSHPGMERWHGDPRPYPNPNVPPPHYETWHGGAPVNTQGGVWFRGPPGAPYAAPPMAAPGGFPMEHFPYYCPQGPAPGLVNSQPVPPHNVGPCGPHSKNGDFCRPIMEPFMRPGMPMRPGFYPGYYGPPMGFGNPNERDFPFMGVPPGLPGPPIYSRYPNQSVPEPNNLNARSCEGRALEQQVDCGPPHDPRRYPSVPAKQIMRWDKNAEEDKSHHSSSQEDFWSEDQDRRKEEQMNYGKIPLQSEEDKTAPLEPSSVKLYGNKSRGESMDVNPVVENIVLLRGHKFIQKVEGTQDMCREEPCNIGPLVNSKASLPINKAKTGVHLERHYPSGILVPVSRDITGRAEDKDISRPSSHKLQGRGDQGGRDRFKSQRIFTSESPDIVTVVSSERTSIQGQEQQSEMQSTVTSRSDGEVKDDSMLSTSDSCDSQRAKMKEIAKQRAIQRQKEEEERAREQKAKALAKLEELNKRSANQVKETSSHKMDNIPSHVDDLPKQDESKIKIDLHFGSVRSEEVSASYVYIPSKASKSLEPDKPSGVICSQTNQHLHQDDPVLSQKESIPATDDAHINDVFEISCQKRAGYKLKINNHSGKNMNEKPFLDAKDNSNTTVTVLKEVDGKNVPSFSESKLPVDSPTIADSLVHPKRKKNNKAGKNKLKVDESYAVSSAAVQKESDASTCVNESMKLKTVEPKLEPLQPPVDSKDVGQSMQIHPPLKPQHARKLPRNSQGRYIEKSHSNEAVVWAPVRSHKNIEVIDDFDQNAEQGATPSTKSNNLVPSSSKSKRAEMERYVPKAAMREPASQQGSNQLSASPSVKQSIPDGMSSKGEASSQIIGRTGRSIEPSHVDNKPKQMPIHGSGRQRGSTESNFVQVSGDTSKNSQTSDLQQKTQKPKEQPKGSAAKPDAQLAKQDPQIGEVNKDNFVDGWNIIDEPVLSGAKDHGSGRGKRNPFKGHRGSGNPQHYGSKYHRGGQPDAEHYFETSQADRPNSSKGKNVAQWQPKSQTVSNEGDVNFIRDTSENSGSNLKHVERNAVLSKDDVIEVDSIPVESTDGTKSEQRPSSGNRRSGNFKFNRGHEFHGDRSFNTQENRQNYAPANREKQRQNSRFEYQPVQQNNTNRRGNNLEGQNENQHDGPRFRDQHHMRRGGPSFYGRQRGYNQNDAGYE